MQDEQKVLNRKEFIIGNGTRESFVILHGLNSTKFSCEVINLISNTIVPDWCYKISFDSLEIKLDFGYIDEPLIGKTKLVKITPKINSILVKLVSN